MTIDTHPYLTVRLFPLDEHGARWTVFVKLAEPIHHTLVSGIRLVDLAVCSGSPGMWTKTVSSVQIGPMRNRHCRGCIAMNCASNPSKPLRPTWREAIISSSPWSADVPLG